jgi:hypothetical protein
MGWYPAPGASPDQRLLQAADYAFREWLKSPLIQRALALNSASAAATAEARLAMGMAQLRASSLLIGGANLALTAGVPLAVWVGVFAAMGAPYAEARALVRNENFQSGFSQGFVTGLLKWEWQQTTSRFFKFSPGQINPYDASLSYIGANAHNEGLRAGYVHASRLDEVARKAILNRLKSLSPGTKAGRWDRLDQISYVIDLASAGRRNQVFKTG